MALLIRPATADRWSDLEALFGARGACGGCWCMAWRLTPKEYEAGKGAPNRDRLRDLVHSDRAPGVIGYLESRPVGWCAVAPRSEYGFLSRSRVLAAVDERPVWSISCLFVAKEYRRNGLSRELLLGAADLARSHGADLVEGYPIDPGSGPLADVFVWTGLHSSFVAAGFEEVVRRSERRPIVRLELR